MRLGATAIAGTRVFLELRPELVDFESFGDALPELVDAGGETRVRCRPGRLGSGRHAKKFIIDGGVSGRGRAGRKKLELGLRVASFFGRVVLVMLVAEFPVESVFAFESAHHV